MLSQKNHGFIDVNWTVYHKISRFLITTGIWASRYFPVRSYPRGCHGPRPLFHPTVHGYSKLHKIPTNEWKTKKNTWCITLRLLFVIYARSLLTYRPRRSWLRTASRWPSTPSFTTRSARPWRPSATWATMPKVPNYWPRRPWGQSWARKTCRKYCQTVKLSLWIS